MSRTFHTRIRYYMECINNRCGRIILMNQFSELLMVPYYKRDLIVRRSVRYTITSKYIDVYCLMWWLAVGYLLLVGILAKSYSTRWRTICGFGFTYYVLFSCYSHEMSFFFCFLYYQDFKSMYKIITISREINEITMLTGRYNIIINHVSKLLQVYRVNYVWHIK